MLTVDTESTEEATRTEQKPLPTYRLNLMRIGYLVMGVGLAVFKWPLLLQAHSLPPTEALGRSGPRRHAVGLRVEALGHGARRSVATPGMTRSAPQDPLLTQHVHPSDQGPPT
jgi:hypothetical protein